VLARATPVGTVAQSIQLLRQAVTSATLRLPSMEPPAAASLLGQAALVAAEGADAFLLHPSEVVAEERAEDTS
jgi:hypothetical protein